MLWLQEERTVEPLAKKCELSDICSLLLPSLRSVGTAALNKYRKLIELRSWTCETSVHNWRYANDYGEMINDVELIEIIFHNSIPGRVHGFCTASTKPLYCEYKMHVLGVQGFCTAASWQDGRRRMGKVKRCVARDVFLLLQFFFLLSYVQKS